MLLNIQCKQFPTLGVKIRILDFNLKIPRQQLNPNTNKIHIALQNK